MIEEKFLSMLREAAGDEEITKDTPMSQVNMDSLELVKFILEIEDEFHLPQTPDDVVWKSKTVQELLNYVVSAAEQFQSRD